MRLARERNARVILSGDTRQHGAVEASDALRAIERHSGVRPVELHTIRRQDPTLGRDADERTRIRQYRKAVESAAAGKLDESFEQLDKIGAVVSCGLGEQAEKLADEYLRLAEQNASAVVISQTWTEVHRVNSRVRDALKAKGLLGSNDTTAQVLERLDLTNAQKRRSCRFSLHCRASSAHSFRTGRRRYSKFSSRSYLALGCTPMLPKNEQHFGCHRVEERNSALVKGHFIGNIMLSGVIKCS